MQDVVLENTRLLDIDAAGFTTCGQKRKVNQDTIFFETNQLDNGHHEGLYLVCDGMGGLQAGDAASQLAVQTVVAELVRGCFSVQWPSKGEVTLPSLPTLARLIKEAIQTANQEIQKHAASHPAEIEKMGTTITMALIYGDRVHIANVGDGRVYLWRSGQVTQLTQDHSLAAQMISEGIITEEKGRRHPLRNVLLRALGVEEEVEIDVVSEALQAGDKLLLCSDGLWRAFRDPAELAERLGTNTEPAELCRQLVAEANERDGSDNISAVVVAIEKMSKWQMRVTESVANVIREVALVN